MGAEVLSRDEFIYTGRVSERPEDSRYRLAQLAGDRQSVLDAGCAVGYIGEYLRKMGPGRWLGGMELDAGAADRARPHYDTVIVGSIEDQKVWDQLDRRVEAIIFGDVLEHTADPVRVLKLAQDHLTDDGIVIISMPNIAHLRIRLRLLRGHFDYEEWGIMDRTHLRFFTFDSARKMLADAGFEVLHLEPIFAFPSPTDLPTLSRIGLAAKARVRSLLARLRPTLVAKQMILVGRRPVRPGVGAAEKFSIPAQG
jgi:2-polyprenyl-3-methyl-5-hydroxy-6-metoxy-1,4-benzoquinol methylase